jgi:hypothetical protein
MNAHTMPEVPQRSMVNVSASAGENRVQVRPGLRIASCSRPSSQCSWAPPPRRVSSCPSYTTRRMGPRGTTRGRPGDASDHSSDPYRRDRAVYSRLIAGAGRLDRGARVCGLQLRVLPVRCNVQRPLPLPHRPVVDVDLRARVCSSEPRRHRDCDPPAQPAESHVDRWVPRDRWRAGGSLVAVRVSRNAVTGEVLHDVPVAGQHLVLALDLSLLVPSLILAGVLLWRHWTRCGSASLPWGRCSVPGRHA